MEGIQRCSEKKCYRAKGKQLRGLALKEINMLYSGGGIPIYQHKSGHIGLQRIWITDLKQAPVLSYSFVPKLLINSEL